MQNHISNKLEGIYLKLLERITNGEWSIGHRIPTEIELSTEFMCSRGTVSRAVARLVHEGLIERKTRAGTKVVRNVLERSTNTLDLDACAFIHPSDQHEAVQRIVQGFQTAAHRENRRVLTLTTGTDYRKEAEIIGRLAEFNVKGAVVYPVILNPQDNIYYRQMILACAFPIVLAELNIPGSGCPVVGIDGLHAGYVMTQHLLRQGARRIGFIANYAWTQNVRDKYLGYRQALNEAGLAENLDDIFLDWSMDLNFENLLGEPTGIARNFMGKHPDLEGIVCADDFLAHGCLTVAREMGIAIPEKLRVAGMDDFQFLHPEEIGLTTYRVPYEQIGQRTFETLEILLKGLPLPHREIQVRGELVVRRSA